INDVLDLSKLDAGTPHLEISPFAVGFICQACLNAVAATAKKKQIQLECEFPDGTEIISDALHLKKILLNLLSNAVKFTPEGGRVRLSAATVTSPAAEGGLLTRFVISDTGIGI